MNENEYHCQRCNGNIINGQPVVLATVVISVENQRFGEAEIYHVECYRAPVPVIVDAITQLAEVTGE